MDTVYEDVPRRGNQHKPAPPDSVIRPWVEFYYSRGLSTPKIHKKLTRLKRFDRARYQMSIKTLMRRRKEWGHVGTRGAGWNVNNIGPHIEVLRRAHPQMGARDMKSVLWHLHGILVSKKTILDYMKRHHPHEARFRTRRRLKRKRFWAAGVSDIWVQDQHDKWKRFQLYLHVGLNPVSGYILWLKIWWTNRNPRRICKYYLDTIIRVGGMPLITQSDPGTENNGIVNAQTVMRHTLDPSLGETLQHRWMRDHQNIKPEIFWSQLRRRWTPGYEDLLDFGVLTGIYNPANGDEHLVFHWLFIPWLQSKLDAWVHCYNTTPKRHDKNSVLPHGPPELIFTEPESYGTSDFKVGVNPELIEQVRQTYSELDHPVHALVPPPIHTCLSQLFEHLALPEVTRENIWDAYSELLMAFQNEDNYTQDVIEVIESVMAAPPVGDDPADFMEVLPWPEARQGGMVIGAEGVQAVPDCSSNEVIGDSGEAERDGGTLRPAFEGYFTDKDPVDDGLEDNDSSDDDSS